MILQALTKLYEDLIRQDRIARPGWSLSKISYALCIDEEGELTQVIPQMEETVVGKKTKLLPRNMQLPAAVKRSVNISSNFLWDNAAYLLGFTDDESNPKKDRFAECQRLHHKLLDAVKSPAAQSILRFFDKWNPDMAQNHPVLTDCRNELLKGANLVFRVNGAFAQEDAAIQEAWQRHYDRAEGKTGQCLVTGKQDVVLSDHPFIKGVTGAQSSGAAIVTFNAPAFCSYGKEQNYNAPVGKYAAFAYTSALNYLLADKDNVQRIGDTTVVCWAEGAEPQYTAFSSAALWGDATKSGWSEQDIHSAVKRLANGLYCEDMELDPARSFYILGLSPNAARLSVRFFLRDSFGNLMRNVNTHHERMEIVRPKFDKLETIPFWKMLQETVNMNSRDKSPSPVMAGATARAVFSGGLYPASLLESTMLRIRAEREINRGRAAILKAFYLKNHNDQVPEEVLQVSLNEQSTNIPYALGRLFAIYEKIQEAANSGLNATIKDKYFNTAASTPATVFPILNNLYQKHLRKLKDQPGMYIYYDKLVTQIKSLLGETLPTSMTLPEQASFDLGYYHQMQKFYEKKEKEN